MRLYCVIASRRASDGASLWSSSQVSGNAETAGTFGLAYAIHKAASPIRFPPTVALTPVVAKRVFGKTDDDVQ